jgi:hypothetical protein
MRPPIKAPDPRDPYAKSRTDLQGAMVSETNLVRNFSSKPAEDFFFSLSPSPEGVLQSVVVVVVGDEIRSLLFCGRNCLDVKGSFEKAAFG